MAGSQREFVDCFKTAFNRKFRPPLSEVNWSGGQRSYNKAALVRDVSPRRHGHLCANEGLEIGDERCD